MPSATGQNWEKHTKNFADDEEPEKKITPLTDEYEANSRELDAISNLLPGIYKY
jgi:hypothetical protein